MRARYLSRDVLFTHPPFARLNVHPGPHDGLTDGPHNETLRISYSHFGMIVALYKFVVATHVRQHSVSNAQCQYASVSRSHATKTSLIMRIAASGWPP